MKIPSLKLPSIKIPPQISSKLNPQIIKPVVIILLLLFYLGLFLKPKAQQFLLGLREISGLKKNVAGIEKEWAKIDSLKKQVLRQSKRIDYYEKRLPGEKEVAALLEYLSGAAKKLGVRITEIRPVQEAQAADNAALYYRVPILLKAECGYHALGRFLNELERADRFMKISDIAIESDLYRGDILYVQLTIVTYVMGQG